jgi:hypothetical protein
MNVITRTAINSSFYTVESASSWAKGTLKNAYADFYLCISRIMGVQAGIPRVFRNVAVLFCRSAPKKPPAQGKRKACKRSLHERDNVPNTVLELHMGKQHATLLATRMPIKSSQAFPLDKYLCTYGFHTEMTACNTRIYLRAHCIVRYLHCMPCSSQWLGTYL